MSSNACYSHELHRRLVRVSRELALLCCIDGPTGLNEFNGFNSFDGFDGFGATLIMSSVGWEKDANAEHALNRRIQTLNWRIQTLNRRIQTLKWSMRTPIDW
ncbi:hypothetical protein J3F84DRAFT_352005 [Trichoderma pleuroticola]